jgi:cardiolipin synthase
VSRRTSVVLFAGREIWPVVRRTLLAVFGVQLILALGLTLVDSWRRRGKKPQPF